MGGVTERERKRTLCELAGAHKPRRGVRGQFVEGAFIWKWKCEHCGASMRSQYLAATGWRTREVGRDGE